MKKGYKQGDMAPGIKDYQCPKGAYSQSFDGSPTKYVERNNRSQEKAGAKLRSQEFKDRYK